MSKKIDQLIRNYVNTSNLHMEVENLPPLPGSDAPMPEELPVDHEPEQEIVHNMTDETWVTAVKTMIELLSYGLHAEDDAIHRDPIAKWLKMKDDIDKDTAWDIVEEIDEFLANE